MKCVLHIGTPKTATTLIQKWLYDNEGSLSQQRVALTRSGHFPNNRKFASHFQGVIDDFMKGQNVQNLRERSQYFADFEDAISSELRDKSKGHDTVIFTSEHLYSRLTSANQILSLKKFLDKFFSEYQIVCYFREQGAVRTSLYSTGLKAHVSDELDDYQTNLTLANRYYNYQKSFRLWEDVFGIDALRPRLFSKGAIREGDIRRDFLYTALPEVDADCLNFQTSRANESLTRSTAKIFRTINALRPQFIGRFPDPVPRFLKTVVTSAGYLDTKQPIYDTRRAEIYETFNSSNISFFERYFGEGRNLFSRPETTPPLHAELSVGEDDFVDFISKILGNEQLVLISPKEVDSLRDLTVRLYDSKKVSADEAIMLLMIANRARPNEKYILSKIEELSNVRHQKT